jgi:hypothetical protein
VLRVDLAPRRETKETLMETLGTIAVVIGLWFVLQFVLKKAGVPT